jgi:hypothetical protein
MRLACNNARTESEVKEISQKWERTIKRWQRTSDFNRDALRWFRSREDRLAAIKTRFTRELRYLKNMRKAEPNELFPQEVASSMVPTVAQPDWSAAIATALKSYSVQTSPVDCPFSKAHGDSFESTRSEKSGSKDWNLHGLRGTEAIQVSSHRGPPTDRPPDKPPPEVGVFAGEGEHPMHPPSGILVPQFSLFERRKVSPCSQCKLWGFLPSFNVLRSCRRFLSRSQSGAELDASEVWSVQG